LWAAVASERSRNGYVRCSRKSVWRRMRALFLEGLLGDEAAQDRLEGGGGGWRSWPMAAASNSGGLGIGTLMPCAISCATMSSSIWRMTMQCW